MLVIVGGHTRNIGKTSVVEGIIRELPEWNWTAVKITQFGHGVCSANGRECDCQAGMDHPYAISEERQPGRGDSRRFLAAGARRAFWVRTAAGRLSEAVPAIRQLIDGSENVIVESNSLVQFVEPTLYVVVLDFTRVDFKASSLRFLPRADAVVVLETGAATPLWPNVSAELWQSKPRFAARPPQYVAADMAAFVRGRLSSAGGKA
jgi:hypothetical protein